MDVMEMLAAAQAELEQLDARRPKLVALIAALEAVNTPGATPAKAAAAVRQARPSDGDESLSGTRLGVLSQVRAKPKVWTAVALAEALDLDKSTVMYHLRALIESRLVKVEGKGRATRYLAA